MPRYDPARRCAACGRLTGNRPHVCATVQPGRRCLDCNIELPQEGYLRWKPRCGSCEKRKWRDKERAERRAIKLRFGGACKRCGYSRCFAALHFHHRDGRVEGDRGGSVRLKELREHPERFELLCANCHIEEHNKGGARQ